MATRKTTKRKQPRKGRNKPGRKRSATTLFVLSKPGGMSAADVVRAAAARGIKLTTARVHTIRGRYQGGAVAQRTAPAAKARGKQYRSASEFVREQPLDRPSKEVVAAGAKVGLKLSQGLVRVIRFHMRHQRSGAQVAAGRQAVRRGRPPARAASTAAPRTAEVQFRKLVVELGVARAQVLVAEVERAVTAYLSRG